MTERREVRLDSVPSLSALYGTALARTAQAVLAKPRATGAALPQVTYRVDGVRVDRERLTAYQHLMGGTASDGLPAGFVHVLGFPVAIAVMTRADFPLPLLGTVHVANRVEQRRRLHADDEFTLRAWAENLGAHRAGTQVDLVVEVGTGDEVVWRGVSTYLAKGRHLPGLAPVEADGAASSGADATVTGLADGGARRSGSEPRDGPDPSDDGGSLPRATAQWRLGADTGRRYAAVSGDRNPIHMWSATARLFGFTRAIAHGMYTAARALAAVGPATGDRFVWEVTFAKPVLLPSTVAVNVTALPGGGHSYAGWDARSGKPHFSGSVRPLP